MKAPWKYENSINAAPATNAQLIQPSFANSTVAQVQGHLNIAAPKRQSCPKTDCFSHGDID